MGGLRRHDSPTAVEESPRVAFAPEVVTGISRPLSNDEQWTLYYFEAHAARCRHCADPLAVSREGQKLCDQGHDLAVDVARILFRKRDGHVYSLSKEESHREVRLEMPKGHPQTESLLRAIQRAVRRGERFVRTPKSFDRHYFVQPRHQDRRSPDRLERAESQKQHHSTPAPSMRRPTFDVKVVSPPEPEAKPRPRSKRDSLIEGLDESKRGSLYGLDMGELEKDLKREQSLKYNLEVREPSYNGGPVRRHVPTG